ncbi:hypothetical protein GXP67_29565 [Rhodocytophaga rosea]|uniref:Uncharacterized protein n=1 Tax=Rhodocytophaga rosea TaxID=2704465 RepID=A0A6C0GQZ3_9BACT|nr:hypothetical protein [Rhodocytophaga rosea]QHT70505.1 hypothetical protein GXP67_29565 [Rhodocytophaga rosea]
MAQKKIKHPGTIVFINGNTHQITHERKASEVPASIRFAETEAGIIPVVKIIATTSGNRREIRQFGPEGQFLGSTLQMKEPDDEQEGK